MEIPTCLTELEYETATKLNHFATYFAKTCDVTIKDKKSQVVDENKIERSSTTPTQLGGMLVGGLFGGGLGFLIKSPLAGAKGGQNIGAKIAQYFEGIKDWNKNLQLLRALLKSEQEYDSVYVNLIQAAIEIFCNYEQPILTVIEKDNWVFVLETLAHDIAVRFFDCLITAPPITTDILTPEFIVKCIMDSKIYKLFKLCNIPKIPFKNEIWTLHKLDKGTGLVYLGNTNVYFLKDSRRCDYGFRKLFSWESKHELFINSRYNIISPDKSYSYLLTNNIASIEKLFILKIQGKQIEKLLDVTNAIVDRIETTLNSTKEKIGEMKNAIENMVEHELHKISPQLNIFNVLKPVATFTGRKDLLDVIHGKLQISKDPIVISQSLAISGLGGIGKSEVSRKYAWNYRDYFQDNVRWISAESKQTLLDSFLCLAEELNLSNCSAGWNLNNGGENIQQTREINGLINSVYKYLQSYKCLFIFDNAENLEDIKDYLPKFNIGNNFHFLITSRSQHWHIGNEEKFDVIIVNEFSPEEAFEYLKVALSLKEDNSCDAELQQIAKDLAFYPLALSHATSYIIENKLSGLLEKVSKEDIVRYSQEFMKETEILLKFQSEIKSDRYEYTILGTLSVSLKTIEENKICGKEALQLIYVMSYMAPDDISIIQYLRNVVFSEILLWKSIKLLEKYSLIHVHKNKVSVHRILQKVVRYILVESNQEVFILEKMLDFIVRRIFSFCQFTTVWSHGIVYEKLFYEYYLPTKNSLKRKNLLFLFVENGYFEAAKHFLIYLSKYKCNLKEIVNFNTAYSKSTPLHIAAARGYEDIVKLLIGADEIDKNKIDLSGRTPLMKAVINGHHKIVQVLAEPGNINGYLMMCNFFSAIKRNSLSDVQKLFSGFCGREQFIKFRFTPVAYAASLGHLDIVKFLVQNKFNPEEMNEAKLTPLISACQKSQLEVVKYLVEECGVDVSHRDVDDDTALLVASVAGNLDVIKYLLNKGSSLSEANLDGYTPLLYASYYGHTEVVKFLLSKGASLAVRNNKMSTPLIAAIDNGKVDVVKLLLEEGSPLQNVGGSSPLLTACKRGNLGIVELLLNSGCDVNDLSQTKSTPLLEAAIENHIHIVDKLLEWGASLNEINRSGNDCLLIACLNGYLHLIEYLMKRGSSLNVTNFNGNTPLLLACTHGHFTVVKYLLLKGANLYDHNKDGDTSLMLCSRSGSLSMMKYLIEKGCSIHEVNYEGDTALHFAAIYGHLHIIEYLIKLGCSVNQPNKKGRTPLHLAALEGELLVVEYLVKNGSSVTESDIYGKTALLKACIEGHLNVVTFLLKNGADITDVDYTGHNGLTLAAIDSGVELVEYLLKNGCKMVANTCGETPLIKAAAHGNFPVVKFFLQNGASTKECDVDGDTPLTFTCMNGHFDIVEYLLTHAGSTITEANWYGNTPLLIAALNGHLDIVKYLLTTCGSSIEEVNRYGNTALSFASYKGQIEVMEYLLSNGATISEINEDAETPLLRAGYCEKADSVKFLLGKGSYVEEVDKYGNSCLSIACISNNLEVVQCLIGVGADKNHANFGGNTPLMKSCIRGNLEIVKYLTSIGANKELRNKLGDTAFYLACYYFHLDVVEYFISLGCDLNDLCNDELKTAINAVIEARVIDEKFEFDKNIV